MAVTLLKSVVDRAKTTLHETTQSGTRWRNSELIEWANESYQAIVQIKPDASSVNNQLSLVQGTKQTIPADGLRLIEVIRCLSSTSRGEGITLCTRNQLDTVRRGWHRETDTYDIEHYMFDDLDPKNFYVYPPARSGTLIEAVYSSVPVPHAVNTNDTIPSEVIRLDDSLAPVMVDYILYRAYSKDADHALNLQRAQMHYKSYMEALGQKVQVDRYTDPNNAMKQVQ